MNPAFIQGLGPLELTIVLVIVLLIVGPKRLPAMGRSLGQGMREFKASLTSRHDDEDPDRADTKTTVLAAPTPVSSRATVTGAAPADERPLDGRS